MVSLFALYKRPQDEQEFLNHYVSIHVPLAAKMPGLISLEWGKTERIPTSSSEDPWFVVAEMRFAGREVLHAALQSPEGNAAAKDLDGFAKGLITMRTVEWNE